MLFISGVCSANHIHIPIPHYIFVYHPSLTNLVWIINIHQVNYSVYVTWHKTQAMKFQALARKKPLAVIFLKFTENIYVSTTCGNEPHVFFYFFLRQNKIVMFLDRVCCSYFALFVVFTPKMKHLVQSRQAVISWSLITIYQYAEDNKTRFIRFLRWKNKNVMGDDDT